MYGEIKWKEVREFFDSGMSKAGIARRLGMSRTTVARLLGVRSVPRHR
ncbi:MAG: helix-turn-helix domain-containing protein [Actinobacteria bacterium]|nr:helix-turn-helix domain-containing protein [Actinomycetota bacterium]